MHHTLRLGVISEEGAERMPERECDRCEMIVPHMNSLEWQLPARGMHKTYYANIQSWPLWGSLHGALLAVKGCLQRSNEWRVTHASVVSIICMLIWVALVRPIMQCFKTKQ